MPGKFLGVGGNNDGVAQEFKADDEGNQSTLLSKRNELATFKTESVAGKGTRSVINRFSDLKNYSAIIVALSLPIVSNTRIILNWYIQKPGESTGVQVSSETLQDTAAIQRFASGYLEIKGTQLSIVLANTSDNAIDATVYIMGIR